MKKITLSLVSALVLSSMSFAGGDISPVEEPVVTVPVAVEDASGFYLGAGLAAVFMRGSSVDFDWGGIEWENGVPSGADRVGAFVLLAGYDFNQYVAVEGRYTKSFTEEGDDPTKMDAWSLFVKPQYTFDESNFKIYALLGFGGVTMEGRLPGFPTDVDDTGFQWGLGAAYSLRGEAVSIFIDYTVLANDMEGIFWNGDTEADADAITAGVTYKF
ncbi:MAG: porin family protein [Campylobacterota bacterium]|nr:porin family protein [Campylobacterota bacterium]